MFQITASIALFITSGYSYVISIKLSFDYGKNSIARICETARTA